MMIDDDTLNQLQRINDALFQLCKSLAASLLFVFANFYQNVGQVV